MSTNFIVNTPRHQVNALAFQGTMVIDCYHQLRDMLRRQFNDSEYISLFAEPSPNEGNQSIDWYTPLQGTIRPLSELPPEEQNALRERLNQMAQKLRTFAEELKSSSVHSKIARGNILELALLYPDDGCLFVAGNQPGITCWGF